MKNTLIVLIVIIILAAGAYFLFLRGGQNKTSTTSTPIGTPSTSSATPADEETSSSANTITFDGNSFSPSSVTVKSGDTLTWINNSSVDLEIGVNPHPIHTGNREISGGEFVLKIAPGESKSVTVTKVGTFGYHNHLNSSQGGSIAVK